MTHSDYTQQLEETVRRQELELIKCREWQDSVYEALGRVREKCGNQRFNDEAIQDLKSMHSVDIVAALCDYIRQNASTIAEEEIKKIVEYYGK